MTVTKFLVMSDNHGKWPVVYRIIQQLKNEVDYIFHCGDSEFQADDPIWEDVDLVVTGNVDFDSRYIQTAEMDTPVGRVLVTHGHLHHVNTDNALLKQLAAQHQYAFVFHGHTHKLYAEYTDKVLLCNPGSLNHSRGEHPYTTYAIVSIDEQSITVAYFDENHTPLPYLTSNFVK